MPDQHDMQEFFRHLERHAGKKLRLAGDVELLLTVAARSGMGQVFSDIIFQAKFIARSREVLKRIGAGAEGYDIMSREFAEAVERLSALLRTLVKEEDPGRRDPFVRAYLSVDPESLDRLMTLTDDLTLIKNWEVDGGDLPAGLPSRRPSTTHERRNMQDPVRNLLRSARMALILLIVLFIIDGPFTIIGWITGLLVAGLIILVQYEAAQIGRAKEA